MRRVLLAGFAASLVMMVWGAFATIAIDGLYPIWWHHPWGFHMAIMFNQIVGWMLAGLVIAGIVKAKRHEP